MNLVQEYVEIEQKILALQEGMWKVTSHPNHNNSYKVRELVEVVNEIKAKLENIEAEFNRALEV